MSVLSYVCATMLRYYGDIDDDYALSLLFFIFAWFRHARAIAIQPLR